MKFLCMRKWTIPFHNVSKRDENTLRFICKLSFVTWQFALSRSSRPNHYGLSTKVALRKRVSEPFRLWTKKVSNNLGYEPVWSQTTLDMNQSGLNPRLDNPGNNPFWRKSSLAWIHSGSKPDQNHCGFESSYKNIFVNLILSIFHSACEGNGYAPLIHENMLLIFFLCPKNNPSFLLRKVSVKEMHEARGLLRWTETTRHRHPDFHTSLVTKWRWNTAPPWPKQYIKSISYISTSLMWLYLWSFTDDFQKSVMCASKQRHTCLFQMLILILNQVPHSSIFKVVANLKFHSIKSDFGFTKFTRLFENLKKQFQFQSETINRRGRRVKCISKVSFETKPKKWL